MFITTFQAGLQSHWQNLFHGTAPLVYQLIRTAQEKVSKGSLESSYKTLTDPPIFTRSVTPSKEEIILVLTLFGLEPGIIHCPVVSQLSNSRAIICFSIFREIKGDLTGPTNPLFVLSSFLKSSIVFVILQSVTSSAPHHFWKAWHWVCVRTGWSILQGDQTGTCQFKSILQSQALEHVSSQEKVRHCPLDVLQWLQRRLRHQA